MTPVDLPAAVKDTGAGYPTIGALMIRLGFWGHYAIQIVWGKAPIFTSLGSWCYDQYRRDAAVIILALLLIVVMRLPG